MDDKTQKYIDEAIKVLRDGGIVIFPTDTAFGIGCRLDDEGAIAKLYSIRKRPLTQAAPVLVSVLEMAKKYVLNIPEKIEKELLGKYWPGALTVILPANIAAVPTLVRGGGLTVGLRMPEHEVPLCLIEGLGIPILGPSANFHSEPTPFTFADINPSLFHLVDYLIPGVCKIKRESTVVDCSIDPWKVIRQGAVQLELRA